MLHQRYQGDAARADPSYRAEVPLAARRVRGAWSVRLVGRADGVRRDASGWVVEELKSVASAAACELDGRMDEAATRQVQLYAWIWSQAAVGPVRAELVWLPLGDEALRRTAVPLDADIFELALDRALDAWIRRLEVQGTARAERARAAAQVRVPFPGRRAGQERLGDAVARTLAAGEQLLIEAPTGLGKTVAALEPALRHALAEGKRLLVLTPTGLAQRAAVAALEALAPPGLATAVRLRARARMCAGADGMCHEAVCELARDYAAKRDGAGLLTRAFEAGPVASPEHLFALGRQAAACPFALSLDAAEAAAATVADYNYVFDPAVRLFAPDDDALADVVLVVDEVHRLPDRVRAARGVALDARALAEAAEACGCGGGRVHRAQAEALRAVADFVDGAARAALDGGTEERLPDFACPAELDPAPLVLLRSLLDATLAETLAYRAATRATEDEDPFVAAADEVERFLRTWRTPGVVFADLASARGGHAALRRVCLDASGELATLLARCHAVVGLSATLGDPELLGESLGLDAARRAILEIPDPFPAENRRLVIDPRVDTRRANRAAALPRVARRLAALATAVPGPTLALLPSHAALATVREALPTLPLPVRWQRRDEDEPERGEHLRALGAGGPTLMLAVAGGVFAESVEVPGGLAAVAVVSPCLPAPDPERELLRAYHDERDGRGFEHAYLVPGMTRVIQAAGRLIRGEHDRGLLALYGARFLRKPYRSLLPRAWLDGRAPEDFAGDPVREAQEFFAGA